MSQLVRFSIRRGTAQDWADCNPVLADGELGYEVDSNRLKVGNGAARWLALQYLGSSNSGLDDIDLSAVADGSIIYWSSAESRWLVDGDKTLAEIVNGGNF